MEAIKNSTEKDIAKRVINNKTIYFIGPFTSRSEAEKLETILKDSGVKDTTLEEIKSE
jgi:carbamoylphosphate synthase small subunit